MRTMKNNGKFLAKISRTIHKTGYKINAKSPELLIIAGSIGVVVGTVLACKATLKVNEKLEQPKEDIEKIHEAEEKGITEAGKEYTEKDARNDLTKVYIQTSLAMVKLYAPAVIVTGLSIAAFTKSHKIMTKRCLSLAAVAKAWEETYKTYRGRVIERFGEELDNELRCNTRAIEIEEKVTNEDGTVESKKSIVNVSEGPTDFAFFFAEGCRGWTKDPIANKDIIVQAERYFTERLRGKGVVFLNEVRDYFGLPLIELGQVAGWIYDETASESDNYVDFGLYRKGNDKVEERRAAFVNGFERNILLDPNCDGYILDRI